MKHFFTIILLVVFISGEKVFTQPIVWEHTGGEPDFSQTCVVALAINSSGHIFASLSTGTSSGLWRSTDGGNSWTRVIDIKFLFGLAINSSGHIFIGNPSGEGVYRSTDNGETWVGVNSGLTTMNALSFAINPYGQLFLGTCMGGVFRTVGSTTSVDNRNEIPRSFVLYQNHPNPFNPETEIRFYLPKATHVLVTIFNTLGQEIRTLVDQPYVVGFHNIRWDGKDDFGNAVSSGVYLYKLQVGKFTQAKKMSLLR